MISRILGAGGECNNNGAQDNGETGVDCGGGGCEECPGMLFTYVT